MSEYRPIACHLHDEYEIAIMRRQSLPVRFLDDADGKVVTILPIDLIVDQGEEFLIYRHEGDKQQTQVRLDRLVIDRLSIK